jgi:hypothetical protein
MKRVLHSLIFGVLIAVVGYAVIAGLAVGIAWLAAVAGPTITALVCFAIALSCAIYIFYEE